MTECGFGQNGNIFAIRSGTEEVDFKDKIGAFLQLSVKRQRIQKIKRNFT
jgi:hypothetical protein